MHAQPNNLRHFGDRRARENAMGERGQIALQREGLVAAATRLKRTVSAPMVDAFPPGLSLAGTFSVSQHVPACANSNAMGLCGDDPQGKVLDALPRDGFPTCELLQ